MFGWGAVRQFEHLLKNVIVLTEKLEKLGFKYVDGRVLAVTGG